MGTGGGRRRGRGSQRVPCTTGAFFQNMSAHAFSCALLRCEIWRRVVWATYSSLFYELEKGQSREKIAEYLGWVPGVGGLIAVFVGGFPGDWAASRYGRQRG
jgi:hypothetical protein